MIIELPNKIIAPDFITHNNYVESLYYLTNNLKAEIGFIPKNKFKPSKTYYKKLHLLKIIKSSLEREYQIVLENPDYANLCVCWISVKSYYLIFNLLLILDYLINGQESSFDTSHKVLLRKYKNYIDKKIIVFNKNICNRNFACMDINNKSVKSGENLKVLNVKNEIRFIQILKKLVNYKLEDFTRQKRIINFRSKQNKNLKKDFLNNEKMNLIEFFYLYRIKANYRDLEFIDKEISELQFLQFYHNYFRLTFNFYNALSGIIKKLIKERFVQK